jgi:hypothetical protein
MAGYVYNDQWVEWQSWDCIADPVSPTTPEMCLRYLDARCTRVRSESRNLQAAGVQQSSIHACSSSRRVTRAHTPTTLLLLLSAHLPAVQVLLHQYTSLAPLPDHPRRNSVSSQTCCVYSAICGSCWWQLVLIRSAVPQVPSTDLACTFNLHAGAATMAYIRQSATRYYLYTCPG